MKKIFLALLFLFPALATAADDDHMSMKYEAYWAGLNVGEATFTLDKEKDSYTGTINLVALGLVKSFTNYWSTTVTKGKIANSDAEYPSSYDVVWQTKKNGLQHLMVNYSDDGEQVTESATPPENRKKHPFVELKYKKNTYDLITTGLLAREKIREILATNQTFPQNFTIPVFDGRRVFDINIEVKGHENKKIDGKKQKLLHFTLTRVPIAGFNPKELEHAKREDPTLEIYMDDGLIPVYATATAPIGSATISMVGRCVGLGCKL